MANLIHEIWDLPDDSGNMRISACVLAGPAGDDARREFGSGALLVHTFEAGSHLEAMNIYNAYRHRAPYESRFDWDKEPYPEEWAERQRSRV